METQNQLRIEKGPKFGGTKLIVNHNNRDLTFLHPGYNSNNYTYVREQIEKDNLKPATMAETASLVHAVFNSDDEYSQEIRKIMQRDSLWAYTGTLYTRDRVYIQNNPGTRNGMPFIDRYDLIFKICLWLYANTAGQSDLRRELEASGERVRAVPFDYETGEMTSLKLAKNPYVIALAGEEGAEKLAEIADKFRSKPYLSSITKSVFDSIDQPMITTVSSLYCSRYIVNRLHINASEDGGPGRHASAFGVQI